MLSKGSYDAYFFEAPTPEARVAPQGARGGQMRARFAVGGALLPLWGVLAWTGSGALEDGAPEVFVPSNQQVRGGGSEAPCAVPLRWRVTRVDREFGMDIAAATEVVAEAAALWEEGAGASLFAWDEAEGFPIRLVYDERQERTRARLRWQAELAPAASAIDDAQAALTRRVAAQTEAANAHATRVRDLELRAAAHNATVRDWNERGGAPPGTRTDLETVGAALEAERAQLEAERRKLDEENRAIQDAELRLNRDVAEYNRRLVELSRELPSVPVQSGEYREAVQRVGGRVAGISREIRIYRFDDAAELKLIAAHELGHALGLGHVEAADAVMGAQHEVGVGSSAVAAISPADAALLAATCPGLARGAR